MLDGAAKITPMLAEAQRLEMPAIGMTDHGNMFGASEFYNAATEAGIKPIIGVEAYIAPGSRFDTKRILWGDPEPEGRRRLGQRLLHPHDDGRRERRRACATCSSCRRWPRSRASSASGRGWTPSSSPSTPRASSPPPAARPARCRPGCGSATTARRWSRPPSGGRSSAPDNYFLELMDHGLSIERRVREGLLEIGRKLDIPPLATNDCHYVTRDAAHNHEALLCVQTGKTLSDPNRFKFDGDGYYLKSAAEMRADVGRRGSRRLRLDAADRRAGAVLRRCVGSRATGCRSSRCPRATTRRRGCATRSTPGCARRFPAGVPPEYVDRAAYEIEVICDKGFPSYFLIVADLVSYARSVDIRVGPGRGSAAGSLVAYALRHHRHRPDRARAAVRAVPQPRARVDARHRHRLRRPPPRRDGALRRRQVGPATGSPRSSPSAPSKPKRR